MINNKLVIGYIGNGKSTNRYHLPFSLKVSDIIKVKTIYNPRIHHDIWPAIDSIYYTNKLDDLLNDPEIDLIVVCTGHHYHYTYAKKVLAAGKHLLCEKPFMETSCQAREIFKLAREKGLFASAYQNRRYDSDFLTVQKVIANGKLGNLLELEMHYDYYRPEIPHQIDYFDPIRSYLYGHGCHTLDQVISYFGKPDSVHYDVRQLLGPGRMNDYFDIDMYYDNLKVSVKSSYFRVKERPSFVVYGDRGYFIKESKDRQEEHLKQFYMPTNPDFGLDLPQHYGTIIYYDDNNQYHEEKVPTVTGDYAEVYRGVYNCIVKGEAQVIKPEETIYQMEMLEAGIKGLK